ncbi:MAG: carboxymuconolactone decarboxylase family protein [Gammaproteobacteria bacterium]|nr:carboxymuconolactone decarboxylase family protein [Gammaproteobacteria bacterium]
MNIDPIKSLVPGFAKDIRLNVSSVLKDSGAPGLDEKQIALVTLASAFAARNAALTAATEEAVSETLSAEEIDSARTAAALMGMNNVYYRFLHLVGNDEYAKLPARLRMNAMQNPGVDKASFELMSIAVSAINGCGMCIESHEKVLRKHDVSAEGIQSAVRIAAVLHAAATAIEAAGGDAEADRQAA